MTAGVAERALTARWTTVVDDAPVAIAVRPEGSGPGTAAVAGAGGLLTLHRIDVGALTGRAEAPGGLLTIAWSPGGSVLAAGGPDGASAWTRGEGLSPLGTTGWCAEVVWHAGGRLAVADGRAGAVLDQVPGSLPQLAWRTPEVASTVTALVWLRDGRELALAAYGGLTAFAPGRTRPVREFAYGGSLLAAAVTPDGRWLVSGNQDASIHVWRRRDGAELEMAGMPRKVTRVAFDASGRWLAADGSADPTVWDFSGRGPGGTSPRQLRLHPGGATAFAWQPARPVLATGGADGVLALWDPALAVPGRPARPVALARIASAGVTAVAWTPDGDTLLAAAADGTLAAFGPMLPVPG